MDYEFYMPSIKDEISNILESKNLKKLAEFINYNDTKECFDCFLDIVADKDKKNPYCYGMSTDGLFIMACLFLFSGETYEKIVFSVMDGPHAIVEISIKPVSIKKPLNIQIGHYLQVTSDLMTSYEYHEGYEEGDEDKYSFDSVVSNTKIGGYYHLRLFCGENRMVYLAKERYDYSSYGGDNDIIFGYSYEL